MQIIISPAKNMKTDLDVFQAKAQPQLMDKSKIVFNRLQEMQFDDLHTLWACSEKIARNSYEYLENFRIDQTGFPAIFSYHGIQYQYLAADVLTSEAILYLQKHLRIISAMYGILRPLDGIFPYRLEMQAKLTIGKYKNLYEFWSDSIYKTLVENSNCIVNLASQEYAKAIQPYAEDSIRWIDVFFYEVEQGVSKQKATLAKMARGEIIRFLAENQASEPECMKDFKGQGFVFSESRSHDSCFVFEKDV